MGNLNEQQVQAIVAAMYPKEIPTKTRLIREGDIECHLYISEQGKFDIYKGKEYQGSFGVGVAFGELALLYNVKRSVSIDGNNAKGLELNYFMLLLI